MALSIETTIALPGEAATEEVVDDVLRHRVQAVVAGDQLVLLAEKPGELALLRLVEVGLLHDRHEVVAEGGVGDLELRDAVLVVERARSRGRRSTPRSCRSRRSRRTPRGSAPRPAISGVPVKPRNPAFGRALRMLSARVSYWVRCASSVMTITSSRSEITGMGLALLGAELLDQREDVAVVLAEQLPQVRRAGGPHVLLGDDARPERTPCAPGRRGPRGR